jgi:hypothetical protein
MYKIHEGRSIWWGNAMRRPTWTNVWYKCAVYMAGLALKIAPLFVQYIKTVDLHNPRWICKHINHKQACRQGTPCSYQVTNIFSSALTKRLIGYLYVAKCEMNQTG